MNNKTTDELIAEHDAKMGGLTVRQKNILRDYYDAGDRDAEREEMPHSHRLLDIE